MPKYTKPITNAVRHTSNTIVGAGKKVLTFDMKVLGSVIGVGVIILILTATLGAFKRTEKYDDYKQSSVSQEASYRYQVGGTIEPFTDCSATSCSL